MEIQQVFMAGAGVSHEVVVRYKPLNGDPYNRPIFEGTEAECDEFIRTCTTNREGDL
jgi:hypothetical protein